HSRRSHTTSSNWKGKERREDKPLERTKVPRRGVHPSKGKKMSIKCFKYLRKGHISFQCPNMRTMILRENRDIESEISQEETSTSSSESGYSSEEAPYEGDTLMVRILMSTLVGDDQLKIENIFHSRCLIQGKCCSLIIDGGSSVNVAN
ncbi:hypothetical protein CR513_17837, partial [Mucuna pruriens]